MWSLSWSGCDKTNNFILFTASILNCLLHPTQTLLPTGSPAETFLYLLLTELPSSEICWSPLLWLWSQLSAVTTLLTLCFRVNPEWSQPGQPTLTWQFLYCTLKLVSSHTCMKTGILSPRDLEIEYTTGWCPTRKPAKVAQSGQKSTLCLVFAPVWLIHLMGTWVFFIRLNLRKMILIWGMYLGTLEF